MAGGTVEKALDVLFHLHRAGAALGLTEIARDLRLPKSSCHRLLASLVERELVDRDSAGRYRPGLALLALGLGAQSQEPVVRAARASLESVAMQLGETVFLVAKRRNKLRVLDKCEGSGILRAAPDIGDVVPSEPTAVGRLYRIHAAAPGDTLDDPEDARVIELGYAVNRNGWIPGLSVLAVPIRGSDGSRGDELVATLAVGAASTRFESLGEAAIAKALLAAAMDTSRRLGPERTSLTSPNSGPRASQPIRTQEELAATQPGGSIE